MVRGYFSGVDMLNRLILIIVAVISLLPVSALAATYIQPASPAYPWTMESDGSRYFKPPRGDWQRVSGSAPQYTRDVPYSVPTKSGQKINLPVPTKVPVDMGKIGNAASKFARRVGPIATGVALADLICDLSDICVLNDLFNRRTDISTRAGYGYAWKGPFTGTIFSDAETAANEDCKTRSGVDHYNGSIRADTNYGGYYYSYSCSANFGTTIHSVGTAPTTEKYTYTPATEADWQSAEPKLSLPSVWTELDKTDEPIPVTTPITVPVSKSTSTDTTTERDAAGTVVGTRETSRQVDLSPAPLPEAPDRMTVIERETTTIRDSTNTIISTSTTETAPPTEPPPDPCSDNPDRVGCMNAGTDDFKAREKTVAFEFTPEASVLTAQCPAPIQVLGHSISYQPACDAMSMIKPVVIGMAAVIAAYILIGAFRGGD